MREIADQTLKLALEAYPLQNINSSFADYCPDVDCDVLTTSASAYIGPTAQQQQEEEQEDIMQYVASASALRQVVTLSVGDWISYQHKVRELLIRSVINMIVLMN